MEYTIGISGPKDTVNQVLSVGEKHYQDIEFVPLIYNAHTQIVELINKNHHNLNGILFTGITPYQIAKKQISFPIPVEYIPREVIILYKILFEMIYDEKLSKIENISIDTFSEDEIHEFIGKLSLPMKDIFVLEDASDDDEVTKFHEQLFKEKKVDICLTTTLDPYLQLKNKGIPIKRILPTNYSIKQALDILVLKTKSDLSQSAQISIGIVNIDNFKKIIKERPSEYQLQKIKLSLHKLLLDYCEQTQSTLVFNGSDEFFIFTTAGSLKNINQKYDSTLTELIRKKLPITVSYGLGLGYTANEAMHNARIALEHAKINGGNCAFLRSIDRSIIGPLDTNGFNKVSIDPKIVQEISQKIDIVPQTVTKILNTIFSMDKSTFDAKEFSQLYGCTLRTAHRILSALTKANVIQILAYDQAYSKGRPYRLYKLNIHKLQNP
ncbi:MAG: hypothetical protein PWQ67_2034 [Clostridia bacterium]|nr:hypothetical protein [Clostridia bacterium]MDN5323580.1 hypothetical protein [Clostridia bacterium]